MEMTLQAAASLSPAPSHALRLQYSFRFYPGTGHRLLKFAEQGKLYFTYYGNVKLFSVFLLKISRLGIR
jgi:hypothetical protein